MIQNNHGEKLVGILHDTGSDELVIVCHGFRSSKVLYIRLFLYGFECVFSCGIRLVIIYLPFWILMFRMFSISI